MEQGANFSKEPYAPKKARVSFCYTLWSELPDLKASLWAAGVTAESLLFALESQEELLRVPGLPFYMLFKILCVYVFDSVWGLLVLSLSLSLRK